MKINYRENTKTSVLIEKKLNYQQNNANYQDYLKPFSGYHKQPLKVRQDIIKKSYVHLL